MQRRCQFQLMTSQWASQSTNQQLRFKTRTQCKRTHSLPPITFFSKSFFHSPFSLSPSFFISIRFFLSNVLPISSYLFFLPYCFSRCRCSLSILSSTFDNPLFICASFPSLFHVSVTVHINTRA